MNKTNINIHKTFESFTKSLNESKDSEDRGDKYKEYFRGKMKEFGVKSPVEMTKDQWEEVNRGWTAEDEGNYHTFFRQKMEEFGVDSPEEMTKDQWEEIDNLWKADNE